MRKLMLRGIAGLIVQGLVFLNCPVYASQMTSPPVQQKVMTEIIHDAPATVAAGQRITLYAEVEDPRGVELARVYFKVVNGANYNFVPMSLTKKKEKGMFKKSIGEAYTATLPAPSNGAGTLEYLLLLKNSDALVVKTQTYSVSVTNSEHAAVSEKPLTVYTELPEVPSELTGFSDNITFDTVESTAKLGVVAGLYSSLTSGGEGMIFGGAISASAGGYTTTSLVVAGVATIAVAGGVAAAAGGGGGGSSDSSSSAARSSCAYQGNWSGFITEMLCNSSQRINVNWRGTVDSSCFFNCLLERGGDYLRGNIDPSTGNATLTGVQSGCGSVSGGVSFSSNSVSGTFSGSGVDGNLVGSKN